jgi:hypothetical protein
MQAPCLCHVGWLVSLASKALNPTLHLTHNMCANNRALATYVLPILSGSVGIMDMYPPPHMPYMYPPPHMTHVCLSYQALWALWTCILLLI